MDMNSHAMLTTSDIAEALFGVALPPEWAGRAIMNTVVDSRSATQDSLFVALPGDRTDGHLYLSAAFQAGAIAAIAEERALQYCEDAATLWPDGSLRARGHETKAGPAHPAQSLIFIVPDSLAALQRVAAHWRAELPVVTVGITGSIGKTTTKEIAANVLSTRYATIRSEGNLNNEIGLPLTLLRLRSGHERAVLEMGMYSRGEIAQLCSWARPRVGIVTNVGPVHLERLGTIEGIAQAKSELPRALPPADEGGVAILNRDDPLVWTMAGVTRARVFTYGLHSEGIRFRCHHGHDVNHIRLPMLGRHSVHTALRGAALGLVEGLSWDEIIHGLQEVRGQLRLLVVPGLRDTTLIDDTYNASPDSSLAALNLVREVANTSHRAIAVFGDMYELGGYEEAGHRLVGGRAAQIVQKLVTVGRRAHWIAEEALASGMNVADVHPVETNTDAIGILQGLILPGDVVLIKGSRSAAMESIVDALSRTQDGRTAGAHKA
jgi:UDP-N-acetylmuramoyl-tripeptide--D-alanyl-D-alanine ligase